MRVAAVHCLLLVLSPASAQVVLDVSGLRLADNGLAMHLDTLFTVGSPDADAGTTQVGAFGGVDALRFQAPLPEALTALIRANEATAHNGPRVAMRMNTLRLEEHRSDVEGVGTCTAHFTFYMTEGEGWVIVDEQGCTLSDFELTSTEGLLPLLVGTLNECIAGFLRNYSAGATVRLPSRLGAKRSDEPVLEPAILRTTSSPKGLFHDFEHFKANMPDTLTAFIINPLRTANGNPKRARLELSNGDPRVLWGFSDGTRLFVNAGRFFVELVREGKDFTTVLPTPEPEVNTPTTMALPVPGLYGLLFNSVATFILTPAPATGPAYWAYKLDLLTGRLNISGFAVPKVMTSRHYFILDEASPDGSSVAIRSRDGLLVQLKPGTFFEFSPERQLEPVTITLEPSSGQPEEIALDTYLLDPQAFTLRIRKDGSFVVKEPPKYMTSTVIDELREPDRAPLPQ